MSVDRRRVWRILEIAEPGDRASLVFDLAIRGLIAANVVAVVVESMPEVRDAGALWFPAFDVASVAVFSVEYLLRVWSAPEDERYAGAVRGRLRFAVTPLALIDLAAVLPAYLPMLGVDLRILRGVRLVRLVRILKLFRYSRALRSMGRTFRRKRAELLLTLSMVGLLVLVASTLMYYAEHAVQPDTFGSIPEALWWGVVTLTTLGYGDVVPMTLLGRIMGGLFALSGLLIVALPTAILGSAFVEEMGGDPTSAREVARCPHCGELLEGAGAEDDG
jgi:voltage-gated potassium channel